MHLRGCISLMLYTMIVCDIILLVYYNFINGLLNGLFANNAENKSCQIKDLENIQRSVGSEGSDFLKNATQFMYKIQNNLCNEQRHKNFFGILLVTSYAGHLKFRAAHREAISQRKLAALGFQRVFLLATLPAKERLVTQAQLENEQRKFGDLLQGNFVEAYRNLSYKHIMGLNWATVSCAHAKFIIKLDDDTIFDIFQLQRYLKTLQIERTELTISSDLLAGLIIEAASPIRKETDKWYVTMDEFSDANYPTYLSGSLYITTRRTALRLVRAAKKAAFFWIDDVWITGILRELLKIPLENLSSWYTPHLKRVRNCVECAKKFNFQCDFYVAVDSKNPQLLLEFLHNVEKCYKFECKQRPRNGTCHKND